MRFRTRISVPLAALSLSAAIIMAMPVSASAVAVPKDFAALSKSADAVVVAQVVDSRSHFATGQAGPGGLILTDTLLRVTDVAQGARPQVITVTQPGGVVGDVKLTVDDLPQFNRGEACVLFLDSRNGVVGGDQGKLKVLDARVPEFGARVSDLAAMVRKARTGSEFSRVDPAKLPPTLGLSIANAVAVPSVGSPVVGVITAAATPVVTSISPSKAIAGIDSVVLSGSGFGGSAGSVDFNNGGSVSGGRLPGTVTSWSDTRIECVVPGNGASGSVFVNNSSGVSSAAKYYDTGFSADGTVWGSSPVSYRINENATSMSGEGMQIRAAFDVWNAVTPAFSILANPTPSTSSNYEPNNSNGTEIYFSTAMPSGGSLAQNYLWSYAGVMSKSVIVLNGNLKWDPTATSDGYDLQSVVLHELGHTVGLLDQYPNTWRVMGAYAFVNRRSLTQDEIDGVNYLYSSLDHTSWSGATSSTGATQLAVAYHQPVVVHATLLDSSQVPMDGAPVVLQASGDGFTFGDVGVVPANPGSGLYEYTVSPESRTYYRFAFNGSETQRRSYSGVVGVTPAVVLGSPTSKSKVKARKSFSVSGSIYPQHSSAEHTVRIKVTRLKGKKWVSAGTYWAKNSNIAGGSRYALSLKLKVGTYRFYSQAPADGGHDSSRLVGPRKVVVK